MFYRLKRKKREHLSAISSHFIATFSGFLTDVKDALFHRVEVDEAKGVDVESLNHNVSLKCTCRACYDNFQSAGSLSRYCRQGFVAYGDGNRYILSPVDVMKDFIEDISKGIKDCKENGFYEEGYDERFNIFLQEKMASFEKYKQNKIKKQKKSKGGKKKRKKVESASQSEYSDSDSSVSADGGNESGTESV